MQSAYLKIVLPAIILTITAFCQASAQVSSFRLKTADSLYAKKMYTQSFEHYEEILRQKQYTPAMLLKMAYIQEGLDNIGKAMYYLNLYFLVTNDKTAQEKMEELADRYGLEGYETTDADRFLTFYHNYYRQISIALAGLSVFMLSLVFFTRLRLHRRPVASGIVLFIFLTALFIHLNFAGRARTGIISNSQTYVMDGPSPGASLVTITTDGHRVELVGKKDVWMKILWDGRIAYVRENSLLPVQL
jgi:hypothetical protein